MTALLAALLAGLACWLFLLPRQLDRLRPARTVPLRGVTRGWWGRAAKEDDRLKAQLPDALGFLAAVLEAGAPVGVAVRTVAEVSPEPTRTLLTQTASSSSLGLDEGGSWASLAEHSVWGRVARDVARSARSGTALVEALRMHAERARQAERDHAIKAARTVGVKSVLPLMVCFLPAFVLIGVVPIIVGLLQDLIG